MKPARKLLILILAFILILPVINTTAFAHEIDRDNMSTGTSAGSEIAVENLSVQYSLTAQVQNQTALANGVSDSTAGSTATADSSSMPAAVEYQSFEKQAQAASIVSDMLSSVYIPPTILSVGREIADFALQYDGYKYVYGAARPSVGFDCSGLVYYVYSQFGYTLPRTASVQYRDGTAVEKSELQPGDLVFFATYGGRSVTHVGIYVGNNEFINATSSGHDVKICSLDDSYWSKAWVGAKRIVSFDNLAAFSLIK